MARLSTSEIGSSLYPEAGRLELKNFSRDPPSGSYEYEEQSN
jgi:hypothetical protein